MTRQRLGLLSALVVVAAASRALPHPPNFTPTAGVALFVAATFPGVWPAIVASFGSMLLGDGLLELGYRAGWHARPGFYPGQAINYGCLLVPAVALGLAIRRRRTAATVAAATLANAVAFFLASNLAVWALGDGATYPRTLAGLGLCYEMALPFFRDSLAGDAFFAVALFGGLAVAEARFPSTRPRAVPMPVAARSSRGRTSPAPRGGEIGAHRPGGMPKSPRRLR